MSYMNSLEAKARYTVAITVLNSFRRWLIGRDDSDFSDNYAEILLDSIGMNQTKSLTSNMILYSFHGFANDERSAAIELSDALSSALESTFSTNEKEKYLEQLKKIIHTKNIESIDEEIKNNLLKLVVKTMQLISNETKQKNRSNFTWKTL